MLRRPCLALVFFLAATAAKTDDLPQQIASFTCNSDNLYSVQISPSGKHTTSSEPFTDGPLTLTINKRESKITYEYTFETELKSTRGALFYDTRSFSSFDPNLTIDRDKGEINKVTIAMSRNTRLIYISIERDYKHYQFLATYIDQQSERRADELNIVIPKNILPSPYTPKQSILALSGKCIKQ